MRYNEVRIELLPGQEGRIGVSVSTAGTGRVESSFTVPLGATGEDVFTPWYEAWRRRDRDEIWNRLEARRKEIGTGLFESIFERAAPSVRNEITAQRAAASRIGLRFRLLLGDTHGSARAALSSLLPASSLPWELLFDPQLEEFLLADWHHSIVRTFGSLKPPRPVNVYGPLRVLIASAEPAGFGGLQWGTEAARIRSELHKRTETQVEILENASLDILSDRLRDEEFHVLHFIGHGGFDFASGEGRLVFDEGGQPRRVSGEELARRIGDNRSLRLIVLNACHSGELATHAMADPLGSIAAALSTGGVPAVVAMQVAVTDSAAVEFSAAFYNSLRMSWPIEAAVAEGRKRIPIASPEWATPVIYLCGESSDLFEFGSPSLRGPADLPLGIRAFVESEKFPKLAEWAKTLDADTERLLALEDFFDGRFIRDPAAWRDPVLFRLRTFLREASATKRPLVLSMVAHGTLAFAAGYYLDTKTANPISVIQSTPQGLKPWSVNVGDRPQGALWEPFTETEIDPAAQDVAVVVEVSRSAAAEVEAFLRASSVPVRRLIRARIAGGPENSRVESGAHAAALARDLGEWLKSNTGNGAQRRLHLFFSAPNGFVFFLGQMATALGKLRLYEYDLEKTHHGTYEASLDLPPVG